MRERGRQTRRFSEGRVRERGGAPWWPRAKEEVEIDRPSCLFFFFSRLRSLSRFKTSDSGISKQQVTLTLISSHVARSWSAARSRAERTTRRASSESDESEPTRNLFFLALFCLRLRVFFVVKGIVSKRCALEMDRRSRIGTGKGTGAVCGQRRATDEKKKAAMPPLLDRPPAAAAAVVGGCIESPRQR